MHEFSPTFSVLSTPVALCDRRALSQAWYSALHAQPAASSPQMGPLRPRAQSPAHTAAQPVAHATPQMKEQPNAVRAARGAQGQTAEAFAAVERRAIRSRLAREIERTFARRNPPGHAAFTLAGTNARVQVLLRSENGALRLIALCSTAARPAVARALAQARFTLAQRGIAFECGVRELA